MFKHSWPESMHSKLSTKIRFVTHLSFFGILSDFHRTNEPFPTKPATEQQQQQQQQSIKSRLLMHRCAMNGNLIQQTTGDMRQNNQMKISWSNDEIDERTEATKTKSNKVNKNINAQQCYFFKCQFWCVCVCACEHQQVKEANELFWSIWDEK